MTICAINYAKPLSKMYWSCPSRRERILGMINTRPDWCFVSPASLVNYPGTDLCWLQRRTKKLFARKIRASWTNKTHGSDIWFEKTSKTFCLKASKCPDCGGTDFKDPDILDAGSTPGVSHQAVFRAMIRQALPADLFFYLEGSDQHRGWFQSIH